MREGVRLGIDVGSVRIGVAVSDPRGVLATPERTVDRAAGSTADIEEIVTLAATAGAVEVVVGLPRHLSGAEGESAVMARQYASMLAERLAPVSVRLVDERLTTVDAHRNLRASGVSGRHQRAVVDQAAAVLILQGALDAERVSGRPPGEPVRPGRRKARTKDGRR